MNATEAKQLTLRNFKNNELLNKTIEVIKVQCEKGLFNCDIYFEEESNMDIDILKSKLKALGYSVGEIARKPDFDEVRGNQYTYRMINGININWQ